MQPPALISTNLFLRDPEWLYDVGFVLGLYDAVQSSITGAHGNRRRVLQLLQVAMVITMLDGLLQRKKTIDDNFCKIAFNWHLSS